MMAAMAGAAGTAEAAGTPAALASPTLPPPLIPHFAAPTMLSPTSPPLSTMDRSYWLYIGTHPRHHLNYRFTVSLGRLQEGRGIADFLDWSTWVFGARRRAGLLMKLGSVWSLGFEAALLESEENTTILTFINIKHFAWEELGWSLCVQPWMGRSSTQSLGRSSSIQFVCSSSSVSNSVPSMVEDSLDSRFIYLMFDEYL